MIHLLHTNAVAETISRILKQEFLFKNFNLSLPDMKRETKNAIYKLTLDHITPTDTKCRNTYLIRDVLNVAFLSNNSNDYLRLVTFTQKLSH